MQESAAKPKNNFVTVGAGNVGSHLTVALSKRGYHAVQIINRTAEKAKILCERIGCQNYSSDMAISKEADFILLTVNDDSLAGILSELGETDIPVFHCSGSTPLSIFPVEIFHHGVIYPLQTFSMDRSIQIDKVPFLVEASDIISLQLAKKISRDLSDLVYEVNSMDRMKYHIAAVFASNFTNHMLEVASTYLQSHELEESILHPLIGETFDKFLNRKEFNIQTGPAVREDKKTIKKHEELLENDPDFQKIYTFVSESIIRYKKKRKK